MKTNVVMKRKLDKIDVYQRTKDGMFNATALIRQWNKITGNNKRVQDFFENENTREFVDALIEEENLHVPNLAYVKSRASRGENAGTWMHPFLFVKFAMWLNPRFEVKVVKFVYDQLIKIRHSAGDHYNSLTKAIASFPDVDFSQVAKGLNWIVFNRHHKDIRNSATTDQLHELDELQRNLAFSVDMGYIKTYPQLISSMRHLYNRKHAKF